jgi:predicted enzyme related to lactoylglutathione lyase
MLRLAQAILFGNDIPRLAAFYRDAFGLKIVDDQPGWVRLETGGAVLALHQLQPRAKNTSDRDDSFVKICFHSDDVEATRTKLIGRGTQMRELVRFGEVSFCDGVDPEENVFQITTR